MEVRDKALFVIYQFLEENLYTRSLEMLIKESGVPYKNVGSSLPSGQLVRVIDQALEEETAGKSRACKPKLKTGNGSFVCRELCSFPNVANGANVLVAQMTSDTLISGCASGFLAITKLSTPLEDTESINSTDLLPVHKAGIVCLDIHPVDRALLLTGSMDKSVCLFDFKKSLIEPIQVFKHHKKFVVRVSWSPSGNFFVSASYDRTICVYRHVDESWDLWKSLLYTGNVEALSFKRTSDVFLVGVRDDHKLYIYDLSENNPFIEPRYLNMNAFGDDYVSFTPMDVSLSPHDDFILVSTDRGRIILFHFKSGEQVMNYYGILHDEYSQPRHCWDPSGCYFYSTSDDNSIVVYELATASMVQKLKGHSGKVRHIFYSVDWQVLVSSSFDGSVKIWTVK